MARVVGRSPIANTSSPSSALMNVLLPALYSPATTSRNSSSISLTSARSRSTSARGAVGAREGVADGSTSRRSSGDELRLLPGENLFHVAASTHKVHRGRAGASATRVQARGWRSSARAGPATPCAEHFGSARSEGIFRGWVGRASPSCSRCARCAIRAPRARSRASRGDSGGAAGGAASPSFPSPRATTCGGACTRRTASYDAVPPAEDVVRFARWAVSKP